MKIAISTDGESVSAHFGRCPSFTIVEFEGKETVKREVIPNPGHHPGYLPGFLREKGVECIIAGGMGQKASFLFADAGIETIVGVTGSVDDAIEMFKEGSLKGGESLCKPGAGKGYGFGKTECDHPREN